MVCIEAGCERQAQPGRDICFKCKLRTGPPGVTFRGGAIVGRGGWHTTTRDFHEQNFGVESGKELARTRPDVERYTDSAPPVKEAS